MKRKRPENGARRPLAEAEGSEVIAGRRQVQEALQAGTPIHRLLLRRGLDERTRRAFVGPAKAAGIPVHTVEAERLAALAGGRPHQGVIALTLEREYVDFHDVVQRARQQGRDGLVLFLDGVQDPQNLGSLLRSADAVGAAGVVIPKHRAAGLTGAAGRASAGAIEHVAVARVTNLSQAMEQLKAEGFWIAGADAEAGQLAWEADLTGPLGLVIGSEGKGLSRLVRERCDLLVRLPMKGHVASLNAAVAGAVLMFEVMRQRWAVSSQALKPLS